MSVLFTVLLGGLVAAQLIARLAQDRFEGFRKLPRHVLGS